MNTKPGPWRITFDTNPMDQSNLLKAKEVVNSYSEADLGRTFREFSEEK